MYKVLYDYRCGINNTILLSFCFSHFNNKAWLLSKVKQNKLPSTASYITPSIHVAMINSTVTIIFYFELSTYAKIPLSHDIILIPSLLTRKFLRKKQKRTDSLKSNLKKLWSDFKQINEIEIHVVCLGRQALHKALDMVNNQYRKQQ